MSEQAATEPLDLEFLNDRAMSREILAELRRRHWIWAGSPNWWSTDYAPDPREYMPFEEFESRLVDVGNDLKLYPEPAVPMTVLDLEVDGLDISFMVTARPFHQKERPDGWLEQLMPSGFDLSIDSVKRYVAEHSRLPHSDFGYALIPNHCLPHLRGMFIEARNTHLFWSAYYSGLGEIEGKVTQALGERGISGLWPADFMTYSHEMTYTDAHAEAAEKRLIFNRRPVGTDLDYKRVTRIEFADRWENAQENLVVTYPVRLDGYEQTLPLAIANRSHAGSKVVKPVVLGLECQANHDFHLWGIWRIIDRPDTDNRQIAAEISRKVSEDFGMPVDTALYIPRPGRSRYERVQPG